MKTQPSTPHQIQAYFPGLSALGRVGRMHSVPETGFSLELIQRAYAVALEGRGAEAEAILNAAEQDSAYFPWQHVGGVLYALTEYTQVMLALETVDVPDDQAIAKLFKGIDQVLLGMTASAHQQFADAGALEGSAFRGRVVNFLTESIQSIKALDPNNAEFVDELDAAAEIGEVNISDKSSFYKQIRGRAGALGLYLRTAFNGVGSALLKAPPSRQRYAVLQAIHSLNNAMPGYIRGELLDQRFGSGWKGKLSKGTVRLALPAADKDFSSWLRALAGGGVAAIRSYLPDSAIKAIAKAELAASIAERIGDAEYHPRSLAEAYEISAVASGVESAAIARSGAGEQSASPVAETARSGGADSEDEPLIDSFERLDEASLMRDRSGSWSTAEFHTAKEGSDDDRTIDDFEADEAFFDFSLEKVTTVIHTNQPQALIHPTPENNTGIPDPEKRSRPSLLGILTMMAIPFVALVAYSAALSAGGAGLSLPALPIILVAAGASSVMGLVGLVVNIVRNAVPNEPMNPAFMEEIGSPIQDHKELGSEQLGQSKARPADQGDAPLTQHRTLASAQSFVSRGKTVER